MNVNFRSRVVATPRPGDTAHPRPRWPVEHPRLRRRRVEIRREEGRRRLRVVVGILAVLGLVGAGWLVLRSPLLDVDRVLVEGAWRSGDPAVQRASGVQPGRAMGDFDPAGAARRVEALPWVNGAVVDREWPGTVRIRVTERVPVALTSTVAGSWAVLDISGRVLEWLPAPSPGLPVIVGIAAATEPGTRVRPEAGGALEVARALPPPLRARLAGITARGPDVELALLPAGTVRLGPAERASEKLPVVESILARVEPGAPVTIDTRFPSTAVLTRP